MCRLLQNKKVFKRYKWYDRLFIRSNKPEILFSLLNNHGGLWVFVVIVVIVPVLVDVVAAAAAAAAAVDFVAAVAASAYKLLGHRSKNVQFSHYRYISSNSLKPLNHILSPEIYRFKVRTSSVLYTFFLVIKGPFALY